MMAMKVFLRLVVSALSLAVLCGCDHYNIAPATSTNCDNEPCLTIDQFVETVNLSNTENLELLFYEGEHILTKKMTLQSLDTVELTGRTQYVYIIVRHNIEVSGVRSVLIENLIFTRGRRPVLLSNVHNVSLSHCMFTKFTGKGILRILNTTTTSLRTVLVLENSINLDISAKIVEVQSNHISMVNCRAFRNRVTYTGFYLWSYELSIINFHFMYNQIPRNYYRDEVKFLHINCAESVEIRVSTFEQNFIAKVGPNIGPRSIIKIQPPTSTIPLHNVLIINCDFISNEAPKGSTLVVENVHLMNMTNNSFTRNSGVVNYIYKNTQLLMANNQYEANQAEDYSILVFTDAAGLVVLLQIKKLKITSSNFTNNQVIKKYEQKGEIIRAVINIRECIYVNIQDIKFDNNQGHFYAKNSEVEMKESITFTNNEGGAVYAEQCRVHCNSKVNITIRNNTANSGGGIFLRDSTLVIKSLLVILQNKANSGGGIFLIESTLDIQSSATISQNRANSGGGIFLRESTLVIQSPIVISQNEAEFGGGICAFKSTIEFSQATNVDSESSISDNVVSLNGGGICILSSTIKITNESYVSISSNMAKYGGGIYLDHSSGIYLYKKECEYKGYRISLKLNVTNNFAQKGGGIFVTDKTARHSLCEGNGTREYNGILLPDCFIQTIRFIPCQAVYNLNYINLFFTNNTASSPGWAIYGGLLDRCTINPAAEVLVSDRRGLLPPQLTDGNSRGLEYMRHISAINQSLISSDPLQLLFCHMKLHRKNTTIQVRKGETLILKMMAVDQAGHAVATKIKGSVITETGVGRLKEGQDVSNVNDGCTEVEYNVFSQDSYAQVELYADGPCSNIGISKATLYIAFLPCKCPTGLQPSSSPIKCECVCDPVLSSKYQITNCSHELGAIQIDSNMWIGVTNTTNGTSYIAHQCVFDYCIEQRPIHISLNSSLEIDRQCAHNRSGVLCGQCEEGLSLVLASSKCQQCSNTYLLLLIPFAVAGIALVAFVLLFNITIATGTINGLIIYANLLAASRLHFVKRNFLTIFVSWVNLDLGIETCFYSGMDSQAKVLLQLVFPTYLFLLMFLIIKLSKHSNTFAKILSNRNPVAALCTLFLLSYSKLVRFVIAALQSLILESSSGSRETVWLYNPNVSYLALSHLPRFIAAAVILTAGGLFTVFLLFGQWFSNCGSWRVMKWTENTKYTAFMDAYHAPFTPKHRYWVGLLLFALIIHNAVVAHGSDDFLSSLSAGCIAASIVSWKVINNRVFKNWLNSVLETFYLLNLIILACGTLYTRSDLSMKQTAKQLASASMALAFLGFVAILCYHTHKYVLSRSKLWRVQIVRNVTRVFMGMRPNGNEIEMRQILNEQDGDDLKSPYAGIRTNKMLDALAPLNEDDYKPPPVPKNDPPVMTRTVVEIHHERLTTE